MWNLVRANFYKLKSMKSLWAVAALSGVWVLLCAFMDVGRFADALWPYGMRVGFFPGNTFFYGDPQDSILATVLCLNAFFWVSILLLVTRFCARENTAASSRTAVAHGASKTQTGISGFISIAVIGELLYLLCYVVLLSLACIKSDIIPAGLMQSSALCWGQSALLLLGFISLVWFVASLLNNSSVTVVLLFFFIIIGLFQSIAYGGSGLNETTEALISINPMSYWLKLGAVNILPGTWVFSLLCILFPLAGSAVLAHRRELK